MPNYNLTGQKIKDTYSQLAQVSGSTLVNGLGVAAPITTASITNFPTEVSRSAAAAGFGQGTGGVSEATFTAYTSSNDAAVATKLATSTFTTYTASANASVSALTTRVNSLESATGSYALKTAISGAFTSLSSSLSTRLTNDETSISSLNSATSSYALKTAISGAFSLPSGVVSSSAQINLAQTQGTASWATNAISASYIVGGTSAGLVAGTGGNSMQSAASLTAIPATASGNYSIALGDGAVATLNSIAIGRQTVSDFAGVAIGPYAKADAQDNVAIGNTATANAEYSIVIGSGANDADNSRVNAVVIGRNASSAQNSIALGYGAQCYSDAGIGIGRDVRCSSDNGVAIGYGAESGLSSGVLRAISIGYQAKANSYNDQISIGNIFTYRSSSSTAGIELKAGVRVPTSTLTITSNTASVNLSNSNFYYLSASGNPVLVANPTNIADGATYTFKITNGTGVVWGSAYKFESGSLNSLSSGTDIVSFVSIGGTELYGTRLINFI
jgi:hypothetical protein